MFLLFFVGVFGGRATDAGYFRHVYSLGVFLQVFGMMMTSLCHSYWQFFLAQGVCSGLANGLMFCAGLSVMSTYFKQWKSIAVGFATCGSVTGGIVYPLMAQHLIPRLGFPWAMRCMGFVCMVTLLVASALYRIRVPPRITGPIIEWAAFRELSYNFFLLGMLSPSEPVKSQAVLTGTSRQFPGVLWSLFRFLLCSGLCTLPRRQSRRFFQHSYHYECCWYHRSSRSKLPRRSLFRLSQRLCSDHNNHWDHCYLLDGGGLIRRSHGFHSSIRDICSGCPSPVPSQRGGPDK